MSKDFQPSRQLISSGSATAKSKGTGAEEGSKE
jgi:hypothetical protein